METIEYKNHIIELDLDSFPMNPRKEYDNLGIMVCFHNKYNLGDPNKHDYKTSDYNGWEELEKAIEKDTDGAFILPLYLLDHSGITIRTTDFGDSWDSRRVGLIYVAKSKIRKEWKVKRITPKLKKIIIQTLMGEVDTYDKYIRYEVFEFLVKDSKGETVGTSSGYYGKECAIEAAKEMIDGEVNND